MSILSRDKVKLNVQVKDKYEAIRVVGQMLVDAGHVPAEYIGKMIEREDSLSTYLGGGLAIPHGTNDARSLIRSTGMSIAIVPDGIDFGEGEPAYLIIGIAAAGDDHLEILTHVAELVSDDDTLETILHTADKDELLRIFEQGMEA
ncbi:PTS sugar transporter subunit IIA [Paenibacillus sepulcri]|uniref:Mannitol-specific phosphotransferase enzyme IIA component n=1 Tax=Paenibacillus sepulcri TaxID=359917 RepID=A0ABS7CCW4_9BACL|nr:PTS sugar transporter subunit IIA [Paenibacillus sepulcri]